MKTIPFSIPIYNYKIKDWSIKKKKLLDLFNNFPHRVVGNTITSPLYIKTSILLDEIKEFEKEIGINFDITNVWFQKYVNSMDHSVHNHGPTGFSSVCFIEFNKNYHKPTIFISPFGNYITGEAHIYQPNIEEGDIIFFPSNLLHYAPINLSNKVRIIMSFNLQIKQECKIKLNYDL
jgi:hypothetical protein